MTTGQSRLLHRAEVKFNPDDYEVKQVFYRSKDGTRIPMFLAYREGHPARRQQPDAALRLRRLQHLAAADVLAQPRRGLAGLGRRLRPAEAPRRRRIWRGLAPGRHEAPETERLRRLHRRGRVADRQEYTRPDKLAINGASNGGLLVGAVMTQRPELFGACLPDVGVMDMLRFQNFTEGREWVDDYGSSASRTSSRPCWPTRPITTSSPACYPPTLISTGDTDDRVVPGHSFKFAARCSTIRPAATRS